MQFQYKLKEMEKKQAEALQSEDFERAEELNISMEQVKSNMDQINSNKLNVAKQKILLQKMMSDAVAKQIELRNSLVAQLAKAKVCALCSLDSLLSPSLESANPIISHTFAL